MSVNAALYSRLSAYAGLTALVATRIYPQLAEQGSAVPRVTIHEISVTPTHAMGADPDLIRTRMQVSSWDTTYDGARTVARQVGTALSRWSDVTAGVHACWLDNEVAFYDEAHALHQIAQDYFVWMAVPIGAL
jgi:hypothetical protein